MKRCRAILSRGAERRQVDFVGTATALGRNHEATGGGRGPIHSLALVATGATQTKLASSVIVALSNFEIGQPALALFAISVNFAASMLGILAFRTRCEA